MIHFTNDFWGHVSWSAAGVFSVIGLEFPGDSQVCDSHVAPVIQDKILRLEVSVHDLVSVKILQWKDDTGDKEARFVFLELSTITDVVSHVATIAVIHG